MKKVKVKKIYQGSVDVRDYVAEKCYMEKTDLEVDHNGETMTIPWHQIPKGRLGKEVYTSKFDGQQYKLVSYPWNPEQRRLL